MCSLAPTSAHISLTYILVVHSPYKYFAHSNDFFYLTNFAKITNWSCMAGNKITKREWKPRIDFYTKWALELGLGYSPLMTSAIKSHQTCEILWAWGCDLFPTPSCICLSENWSKTFGGKLVGFSSVKDVDLILFLKSVSIFSYYWLFFGYETFRVYHALLYSRQTCEILRARDCDLFPTICLILWVKT